MRFSSFQQVVEKYHLSIGLEEGAHLEAWENALRGALAAGKGRLGTAQTPSFKRKAERDCAELEAALRVVSQSSLLAKLRPCLQDDNRETFEWVLRNAEKEGTLPKEEDPTYSEYLNLRCTARKQWPGVSFPGATSAGAAAPDPAKAECSEERLCQTEGVCLTPPRSMEALTAGSGNENEAEAPRGGVGSQVCHGAVSRQETGVAGNMVSRAEGLAASAVGLMVRAVPYREERLASVGVTHSPVGLERIPCASDAQQASECAASQFGEGSAGVETGAATPRLETGVHVPAAPTAGSASDSFAAPPVVMAADSARPPAEASDEEIPRTLVRRTYPRKRTVALIWALLSAAVIVSAGSCWWVYGPAQKAPVGETKPKPAETNPIAVKPATISGPHGGLLVRTKPVGATICVGTNQTQQSPAAFTGLAVGKQVVTVSMEGYDTVRREADIKENDFADVGLIEMVRCTGILHIDTQQKGVTYEVTGISNAIEPRAGLAPARLSGLPAGDYDVTLHREGWADRSYRTTVRANETTPVTTEFQDGGLLINVDPPGAEVSVDEADFTAPGLFPVHPGIHQVKARYDTWPVLTKPLLVEEGQTNQAMIRLPYGIVVVESEPAGATVRSGTNLLGKTPLYLAPVPPGLVTYSLELSGHEPAEASGMVKDGEKLALTAQLVEKPPLADFAGRWDFLQSRKLAHTHAHVTNRNADSTSEGTKRISDSTELESDMDFAHDYFTFAPAATNGGITLTEHVMELMQTVTTAGKVERLIIKTTYSDGRLKMVYFKSVGGRLVRQPDIQGECTVKYIPERRIVELTERFDKFEPTTIFLILDRTRTKMVLFCLASGRNSNHTSPEYVTSMDQITDELVDRLIELNGKTVVDNGVGSWVEGQLTYATQVAQ